MGEGRFINGLEVVEGKRPARSSRPTVLFLHGASLAAWSWDGWHRPFNEAGFPTAALSLRGHGRSAGTYRGARIQDYVEDVRAVLQGIGAPPILIGHSLGGRIAQMLVLEATYPAAVFLAPVVLSGIPRGVVLRQLLRHPVLASRAMLARDMGVLTTNPTVAGENFFSPDMPLERLASMSEQFCGESFELSMFELARPVRVPSLPASPTLLLAAELDPVGVERQRRSAVSLGSEFVVLEGSGHNVTLDVKSGEAAEIVTGWLCERFVR